MTIDLGYFGLWYVGSSLSNNLIFPVDFLDM